MRTWLILAGLALTACDDTNPCDEYVAYICDCHPDDDCSSLSNTYDGADTELQDECALALDEQLNSDDETEHECGERTDTGN